MPITFAGGPTNLPQYLKDALNEKLFSQVPSLLELNSESKEYKEIIEAAKRNIVQLLNVPEDREIWFLGAGAHLQFAAIPMNFGSVCCNYTCTGYFSKLSYSEAKKFALPHSIAEMQYNTSNELTLPKEYDYAPNAVYTHFVDNESVEGIEYPSHRFPVRENTLLIDDCSSSFLTKDINWNEIDMAYAHAQKNCGISGLTITITNDKCLKPIENNMPEVCSFQRYHSKGAYESDLNIIPVYANYIITSEMIRKGGITMNDYEKRSKRIYDILDRYEIFRPLVEKELRSRISVTWKIINEQLAAKCLEEGAKNGLYEFKGHRTMGGFRASLFAPIPDDAVYALAEFLESFAEKHS